MCGIYRYDKCLRCGRGNILYISKDRSSGSTKIRKDGIILNCKGE